MKRLFRFIFWFFVSIATLLVVVVLLIRTPWAQQKIIGYASGYVEEKAGGKLQIGKFYLGFDGSLIIKDLYVETPGQDTLLFFQELDVAVSIAPLLNNRIVLRHLDFSGLMADVVRHSQDSFNFSYLIEAFAGDESVDEPATEEPDTASTPWTFDLGAVNLEKFHLRYRDSHDSLNAKLHFSRLYLVPGKTDFDNLHLEVRRLHFEEVVGFAEMTKTHFEPTEDDTTASTLPLLVLHNIEFKNLDLSYKSANPKLETTLNLARLNLSAPFIDLEKADYKVRKFDWVGRSFALEMPPATETPSEPEQTEKQPFEWPKLTASLRSFKFHQEQILLSLSGKAGENPQLPLDFDQPEVPELFLEISELQYQPDQIEADLLNVVAQLQDNYTIDFATKLKAESTEAVLENLQLTTPHSRIHGSAKSNYSTLDQIAGGTNNLKLKGNLSVKDAQAWQPELRKNPDVVRLGKHNFTLDLDITYRPEEIVARKANVKWGRNTFVDAAARIENLSADFPTLHSAKAKIFVHQADLAFLAQTKAYPHHLNLDARADGNGQKGQLDATLKKGSGQAKLRGNWANLHTDVPLFDFTLSTIALDFHPWDSTVAALNLNVAAQLTGTDLYTLSADVAMSFDTATVFGYGIAPFKAQLDVDRQRANLFTSYRDSNLIATFNLNGLIDTLTPEAKVHLEVDGADFYALKLYDDDLRGRGVLDAEMVGSGLSNMRLSASLYNALLIQDQERIEIDSLDIRAFSGDDTAYFNIKSGVMNGYAALRGNVEHIPDVVRRISGMDPDTVIPGREENLRAQAHFAITETATLSEVLLPEGTSFARGTIDFELSEESGDMDLDIRFPWVVIETFETHNLGVWASAQKGRLNARVGFDSLVSNQLNVGETYFKAFWHEGGGNLSLRSEMADSSPVFMLVSNFEKRGDTLKMSLEPDSMILAFERWEAPPDNALWLTSNAVLAERFFIKNNGKEFRLVSPDGVFSEDLDLRLNSFPLEGITSLLDPESPPVTGILNGRLKLENLYSKPGFAGDLSIDKLHALRINLGELLMEARHAGGDNYQMGLRLTGPYVSLLLDGGIEARPGSPEAHLTGELEYFRMKILQDLSPENIDTAWGRMSANLYVDGPLNNPDINGNLSFDNAGLKPTALASSFRLEDAFISLSRDEINFERLTVKDDRDNPLSLSGKMNVKNPADPSLDLKLSASDFQLLNSTRQDNDLFYGTLNLNIKFDVTGKMSEPVLRGRARLNKNTSVTFIVPETQADIVEREGVMIFVNRKYEDHPLTRQKKESEIEHQIRGIDLVANLEIDPNTRFAVILDERSGDMLEVNGGARLRLDVTPEGIINLAGEYAAEGGFYQMRFYEVVSKKFNLVPGSRIIWSGDPLEASLDLSARHRVRTSPANLMADQLGGADVSVRNMYRQELPFELYIKIGGQLLQPEISFRLDMEENQRGAMGGNVYSRLQQLNQDESEVNTQAFALLVLGSFVPQGASEGPTAQEYARNSVSQIMSQQLNQLSDKYVKGVELDLNLNSYRDYTSGTGEDRTQLNVNLRKRFFDERLVVQVGSNVDLEGQNAQQNTAANLIGDISIEYMLTPSGRYRIRGFRKNQFEGLVEGQLISTGTSLLYNRDFNRFRELFTKPKEEALEEEATENEEELPDPEQVPEEQPEETEPMSNPEITPED